MLAKKELKKKMDMDVQFIWPPFAVDNKAMAHEVKQNGHGCPICLALRDCRERPSKGANKMACSICSSTPAR